MTDVQPINGRKKLRSVFHTLLAIGGVVLHSTAASAAECAQPLQEEAAQEPAREFLARYVDWAKEVEREGLERGTPLDAEQLQLARAVGVNHPERVRLVWVDAVPFPSEDRFMREIGESVGFVGPGVINNAQAFGYTIWVRKGFTLDRPNLAHELVHVRQIEESGDFGAFVALYMQQLREFGHTEMPIEAEAYEANRNFAL